MPETSIIASGRRTVALEQQAIALLTERIDDSFCRACTILLNCPGRVIVVGMGKSGHIANKIAATLASTGTPAFFVHPAEASHGDMGMITGRDTVLALSNSGTTNEILTLLPLIRHLEVPLVSMTGDVDSALAAAADVNLDVGVHQEACPLNLAPTSSTTAALVMGDALAIALLEQRGFTAEDFAFSHPGGALGKRLLLKVKDVMRSGPELPCVAPETLLKDALMEISEKGLGMTTVVDSNGILLGIFTDGDLRRSLDQVTDCLDTPITQVMTTSCKTTRGNTLAAEALGTMEGNAITSLPVVDDQRKATGVLHLHDLIKAGLT